MVEYGSPEISSCDVKFSSRDIMLQYNECRSAEIEANGVEFVMVHAMWRYNILWDVER